MNNNIDFTFYSGNDTYEAMTSSSEIMPLLVADNYDDVLQNGSSPAYLHHLSSNRKSLIDWYPFDENASLLEIGAESGVSLQPVCGILWLSVDLWFSLLMKCLSSLIKM